MLGVTILLFGLLLAQTAAGEERTTKELALRQVEWLRSKGGFYSPKIAIEPLFESDSANVPLGLFAKEGFNEGEVVMEIPRHALLTTGTKSKDMCDTALNLVKQYKLKDESEFEPYVTYVFSKDSVTLPSTFSDNAKALLSKIRGKKLPPEDLTDVSFANECQGYGQGDDELEEFAYLTVVCRAWSSILVPLYDMINHQSGRFWNIDSTLVQGSEDVSVYAIRDIPAGEQLHLSYMDCIDERGYENEYVLPQMLRDMGFVDQYPQRWTFPADPTTDDLVFDIDFVNPEVDVMNEKEPIEPSEMQIHWRTREPNKAQIKFLRKQLERMEKIRNDVATSAEALTDDYERTVVLDYYSSLTLALQVATGSATQKQEEGTCDQGEEAELGFDAEDWMACNQYSGVRDQFRKVEDVQTYYQYVEMYYGEQDDDACLYLDGWLHMCASARPHYHEVMVHYPARFLDEVKRVLFIGGGDSMALHEVMKYQELELVVGLELDHTVVRSTFKNYGIQPHFDNDKVQWYFGDAAKSLLTLPSNYYGSFDLVILDITTKVAEALKVNHELKVMDAALMLMKQGGIFVKNEDEGYVPGSNKKYTRYSMDVAYHDVPQYCLQVMAFGSNSVDFLTTELKDHNVETIYLAAPGLENFDSWYNYGEASTRQTSQVNMDKAKDSGVQAPCVGVLMALEAEAVAVPLASAESVKSRIIEGMAKSGLDEITSLSYDCDEMGFSFTVIAGEGYVAVRCFLHLQYCAFDIHLYGAAIANLENTKAALLEAVKCRRWSSYRFVTGGIWGLKEEKRKIGPPPAKELFEIENTQGTAPPTKVRKEKSRGDFGLPKHATLHSYNTTLPLAQWKYQKTKGTQVLLQLEVPLLVGEKVRVKSRWLDGTIVRGWDNGTYTISFNGQDKIIAKESKIKRSNELDKSQVTEFMNDAVELILNATGYSLEPGSFARKEAPEGVGEGSIIATSWKGGNVVATWDGDDGVTLNFFFASTTAVDMGEILSEVPDETMIVLSFDEFPRGTGNVVTFDDDVDTPVWA